MDKASVGAILKQQRTSLGLSVDDIVNRTFISPLYLMAIEEGQYDRIRDPVYTRGFIRNYAEVVGLDGNMLVQQFNEETSADEPDIPSRPYSRRKKKNTLAQTMTVVATDRKRKKRRSFTRTEWIIIAFIVLALVAFWGWFFYI